MNDSVVIAQLRGEPGVQVVSLFKQAFPKHPASLLDDAFAAKFLRLFAERSIFLVARDPRTGADLGFAIGGAASALDGTRVAFIRSNLWALAALFLSGRLPLRMLFARLRPREAVADMVPAPYQLRFIAVDPRAHGAGIGTQLLEAFEEQLPPDAAYHAWTLEGEDGAVGFYLRRGFQRGVNVNGHVRLWKKRCTA